MGFTIHAEDRRSRARAGTLHTAHGDVDTPALCPVAVEATTLGGLLPRELDAIGVGILSVDPQQLAMRSSAHHASTHGGAHGFMAWSGPLLSDTGGWRSLSQSLPSRPDVEMVRGEPEARSRFRPRGQPQRLVRVDDDGITVSSHVDGTAVRFTPRSWMVLQEQLGADLNVALHPPASRGRSSTIADRSISWAERCIAARTHVRQGLLAAVPDLPEETESRSISLHLAGLPFDGFVVGPDPGAEPRHDLAGQLGRVVPFLPGHLPRHAGGVYGPRDVFAAVRAGIDTFDCLEPLRLARHGFLFTSAGPISIREPRFRVDFGPPDDDCACTTCERFSSAYLHHLFACEELLAYRLATVHNLALLSRLTARIRSCIREGGRLSELEREMLPETT